jgi:cysteinyl-tRNA synthetase
LSLLNDSPGGTKTNLNQTIEEVKEKFIEAMDDDFNSPRAFAAIHEFISSINSSLDNKKEILDRAKDILLELLMVFGLDFSRKKGVDDAKINELMELIINVREQARKDKNYTLSDEIRDKLGSVGIQLEDTDRGPRWRLT